MLPSIEGKDWNRSFSSFSPLPFFLLRSRIDPAKVAYGYKLGDLGSSPSGYELTWALGLASSSSSGKQILSPKRPVLSWSPFTHQEADWRRWICSRLDSRLCGWSPAWEDACHWCLGDAVGGCWWCSGDFWFRAISSLRRCFDVACWSSGSKRGVPANSPSKSEPVLFFFWMFALLWPWVRRDLRHGISVDSDLMQRVKTESGKFID